MQPSAIYDAADSVIAQRLSQVDGVAEVTVAGSEQPAIRVRVDPGAAVGDGPVAGGRAHRHLQCQCGRPARLIRRQQARRHDRHQRPAARRRRVRSGGRQDGQRHGHPPVDVATIGPSVRNTRSAGWFNSRPFGAAHHYQAGQRQRNRDRRPDLRAAARTSAMGARRSRHFGADRPHADHPRQRARHAAHARGDHRAGDAGRVPVPAARRRRPRQPA